MRWLEDQHLSFSCCRIIRTILTSTSYSSTNSIDLLILNLPPRSPLYSRPPGVGDDDTHPQSSGPEETPAIRSARAWLSSFTRKGWKLCKFVDHRGSKSPPRKRGEYYSEAVPGLAQQIKRDSAAIGWISCSRDGLGRAMDPGAAEVSAIRNED